MEQLIKTAEGILSSCLAVKEGEEVLIVTDDTRKRIGEALYEAAGNLGCERLLMVMKERELSGQEPPKAVAAAMKNADVVVAPTAQSLTHTNARIEAAKAGTRVATMPGITEEMFSKGAMTADYDQVEKLTEVITEKLTKASEARIEKDGKVLKISLKGRNGVPSPGRIQKAGTVWKPSFRGSLYCSSHELNLVDVQKRYKEKDAVIGFTFTFTNGVYGLLGENGAGKTTLMRLICGILQPTNGSITCDNIRISDMGAEYRQLLGYLPQNLELIIEIYPQSFFELYGGSESTSERLCKRKVKGILKKEERAPHGRELRITGVKILSFPVESMPLAIDKWKLNTSLESKLNMRSVALRNIRERSKFRIQEALVRAFRDYLYEHGFTEIHTPKLGARGAEGGANVFKLSYFHKPAVLAQSPQFYKQMMVGVFDRVFETGPVFRAEKHNTKRHLNEYTSLDLEMGYIDSFQEIMSMETGYLQYAMALLKKVMIKNCLY